MRKSALSILPVLVFNFLTGCNEPAENIETSIITTIPFAEAKEFKLSDFVEEQKYILLSTDEDALFKRVDKLIAKNEHFYLFDHLANSGVLVFDKDGNFVQKIGDFGDGPKQLKGITDFQVGDNGEIQLLDKRNKSITIYSPEGILREQIAIQVNSGGFAQLGDKWFLAINFDHQNENLVSNQILGVFDATMELDSLYFHYAEEAFNVNLYYHAGLLSTAENKLIYHRPPNDTISIFSKDGQLANRLIIDFAENRLPEEAVNDFNIVDSYRAQDASFRYLQTPALLAGDYIVGIILSTKQEFWTYAYKISSNELYSSKVDLSQLHLKDMMLAGAYRDDKVVVSMIDPVTFSQDSKPDAYPEHVRTHLENEGSVLLLHYLKP
ncbi:6-bladed beta-propeller [Algoriphagus antarcticus]|uniref:6-bladed beta-propeller protein n=1 Tax=Algoriphagus antarcticus TaxID=238540 RepID=A0A3E0EB92_9BACT|nr:6-bladed beta-propeller [Algoriphagus antarcticus]REG94509.1 6-bladed beta-propeller protein [Algoriphagus antarcticus]